MAATVVLPAAATIIAEGQIYEGFPGVWYPDTPIPVETLGLTEEEAQAKIVELNLPHLVKTGKAKTKPAKPDDGADG